MFAPRKYCKILMRDTEEASIAQWQHARHPTIFCFVIHQSLHWLLFCMVALCAQFSHAMFNSDSSSSGSAGVPSYLHGNDSFMGAINDHEVFRSGMSDALRSALQSNSASGVPDISFETGPWMIDEEAGILMEQLEGQEELVERLRNRLRLTEQIAQRQIRGWQRQTSDLLTPHVHDVDTWFTRGRVIALTYSSAAALSTGAFYFSRYAEANVGAAMFGRIVSTAAIRSLPAFYGWAAYGSHRRGRINNISAVVGGNLASLALAYGVSRLHGGDLAGYSSGAVIQNLMTSAAVVLADQTLAIPAIGRINRMHGQTTAATQHAAVNTWRAMLHGYAFMTGIGSFLGGMISQALGHTAANPIDAIIFPLSFGLVAGAIQPGYFNHGINISRFYVAGLMSALVSLALYSYSNAPSAGEPISASNIFDHLHQ